MNTLKIFEYEGYGQVEVIIEENKEYFEATRVAQILGYSNPHKAIRDHCKIEGVRVCSVGVVTGKRADKSDSIQFVNKKFIDQGNLYRLIIKSRLEKARKFERWLFDEVLPSIRKYGAYMKEDIANEMINNPDLIIKMLQKLKHEKEKMKRL